MTTMNGVVVAYDGSDFAMQALDWAMDEAEMRKLPLTVAHAWHWPYGEASDEAKDHLRRAADHVLWHGVSCARATSAVTEVKGELWKGSANDQLVALSGAADLLVVGSRGLSRVPSMMIGSVACHVAAYAACPALVVRGPGPIPAPLHPGPVVVGVDGTPGGRARPVVEFAFAEAALRQLPLVAVRCGLTAPSFGTSMALVPDLTLAEEELGEALTAWQERYPEVRVSARVTLDAPREALTSLSKQAGLIVVGRRRFGHLGSTADPVLRHAACAVAVVAMAD
ncbi:universal stress protein [Herbidospora solisilvae]|nr:universal stress protein [Herbidospora solisilvae]